MKYVVLLSACFLFGTTGNSQNLPVADFTCVIDSFFPGGCCYVSYQNTSVNAPDSVIWHLGDGVHTTVVDPIDCYFVEGTYTIDLIAMNQFGADTLTAVECITVDAIGCYTCCGNSVITSTGHPTETKRPKLKFLPNPMQDFTNIQLPEKINGSYSLQILDSNGNVLRRMDKLRSNVIRLNRNQLEAGLFIVEILQNDHKMATGKLMVE